MMLRKPMKLCVYVSDERGGRERGEGPGRGRERPLPEPY
jgi:hypothetical protein